MRKPKSLDRTYFEGLYQENSDPWNFAQSAYEQAKYDRTLQVLGDESVRSALEVGCSIGILTARLAQHCRRLTSTDISPKALEQAQQRCADLDNVEFRLVSSAGESFQGEFDLIVLSEVVYYWDDADAAVVANKLKAALRPGGRLLMVHWLGETDYPKSGDEAVEGMRDRLLGHYTVEKTERTAQYRLDLWRWTGAE